MSILSRVNQLEIQFERSALLRYAAAVAAVLVAMLVRYSMYLYLGASVRPFATFYLAVIFMTLQTTPDAAVLALVLAACGSLTLVGWVEGSAAILSLPYLSELGMFVFVSLAIVWIGSEQRKARIRAEYRRGAIENVAEQLQRLKRDYEQTIRQLDRESAYLESLLRQMPSGVVIASPEGDILSMNRRAEELLGRPRSSLKNTQMQDPFTVFLLNEATPMALDDYPLARALKGETVRDVEVQVRVENGATWMLRVSSAPIYNMKGDLIAGVLVIDDMAREYALREAVQTALAVADVDRRRLQTVLDVIPVGVVITDAKGELVYMNAGIYRVWGDAAPKVGSIQDYHEYKGWHIETGEMLKTDEWAVARALLRGETTTSAVVDIERFDGRRAKIINAAAPILDEQGAIIGAVAVNVDIDELQLVREALVEEETRFRSLTQYINEFSHDFKTPLSIINTTSYLLDRAVIDDRDRPRIKMIQDQTMRLSKMVDNLITLVSLDGGANLDLLPLDLGALAAKTMETRRELADNKGVMLKLSIPECPVTIMGDPNYLGRALGELLDNALRFTETHGEISVRVSQSDTQALLTIEDTGVGVMPDALERIFQIMYRADEARSPELNGLALGLTIVRLTVEQHHGQITVTSQVGRGTVFCITLPLVT